jgi:hypothetical protein
MKGNMGNMAMGKKNKRVKSGSTDFAAKGGPSAIAAGPSTPMGKGIVAVRNKMPKAK